MTAEETFRGWMADMEAIRLDVHELFRLRRTFRDVAEVFRANPRLQDCGGHLWDWMRLNYAASILIRLRRLVDKQDNTVNLKQLLHSIIRQPEVVSRAVRDHVHPHRQNASADLRMLLDQEFSAAWVRGGGNAEQPESDHVDPQIVQTDLSALEAALKRAVRVANQGIAHRQRVQPGTITMAQVDEAFDAVESTLQKYYALLCGSSLYQAEPTPQFNTHEVFTFPWIDVTQSDSGEEPTQ